MTTMWTIVGIYTVPILCFIVNSNVIGRHGDASYSIYDSDGKILATGTLMVSDEQAERYILTDISDYRFQ